MYTDLAGRRVLTEYPDEAEVTMTYNVLGQLVSQVDADGVTTLYAYNGKGEREITAIDMNQNGVIDFAGMDRVTQTVRDVVSKSGTVVRRTTTSIWAEDNMDVAKVVSITEQDGYGNESWQTDISGNVVHTATLRGMAGEWEVITTLPDGSQQVQEYDGGRLSRNVQLDALEDEIASVAYVYDDHGRVVTQTDARTGATSYIYNDRDEILTTTTNNGQDVTTMTYNALGQAVVTELPDESEVFSKYDLRGQLIAQYGSQTNPVEYGYDPQGRRVSMTTWKNFNVTTGTGVSGAATTEWVYDAERGWLNQKLYPDNKGPGYTYTAAGRLESRTWERGAETTYTYNNAGDLAETGYSDATPTISLVYDRLGRQQSVTDGTGTRVFAYRSSDLQLESETLPSYYGDRVLSRVYAASGVIGRSLGYDLGTLLEPDADLDVRIGYDQVGRVNGITSNGDTFSYSYLANSHLLSGLTGPAHEVSYTYEPHRDMKTVVENNVGMTTVSRFTYRYDELGRRTDRVDTGATFGTDELSIWDYDELGQVVYQNRHAGNNPDSPGSAIIAENFEFNYDHIGNRLSSQQGTATARSYSSNPLNQYTSITNPGAAPQYDDDGNMTFDGIEWYFTWDGENRLIFARNYQTTASSGDVQISFAYDYQSRRVEKVVEEFNGSVWNVTTHHRFVYDGWNLLAELEEDSSEWVTAQTYLWGLDLTQSFEGAGGVGGLLAITRNDVPGTTYYPTYDANGNVMELYDELGNNAAIYRYGPFGELVSISESAGVRNPFKYSTKYFDEELELYYYGYRYYDPETGRWLNRDPIEERGGLNLYGFVGNDGVGNWDLLGMIGGDVGSDVWTSSGGTSYGLQPIMSSVQRGVERDKQMCCKREWRGSINYWSAGLIVNGGFFAGNLKCEDQFLEVGISGYLMGSGLFLGYVSGNADIVHFASYAKDLLGQTGVIYNVSLSFGVSSIDFYISAPKGGGGADYGAGITPVSPPTSTNPFNPVGGFLPSPRLGGGKNLIGYEINDYN